jgi:hypothetical protein
LEKFLIQFPITSWELYDIITIVISLKL